MGLVYKPVKLSERKPDFTKRIFLYNSTTKDGVISEYIPNQQIEMKKGRLKYLKGIPEAIEIIISSYTHWLEPTIIKN